MNTGIRKIDEHLHELLDPLDKGPRRFLAFLFLNILSCQALLGTMLVLHARALGIDAARVGVLNSFMYFTGVMGLVTKPLAERIGSRRLLMGGWTLRYILVAPVVAMPWVFIQWGVPGATILLGATTLLFCMTRALAGIAWSSWLHEIIPSEHLARYYTLESMLSRILMVAFGVLAFFMLGHHPPLWRFALIAALGVAAGLFSIRALARVPGGAPATERGHSTPWHYGFGPALHDRAFIQLLLCTAISGFAQAGQMLLFALMLRDRLHLGPGLILLLTSTGSALTLITAIRWRRVADTHGSPVTLSATTLLLGLCMAGMAPLGIGKAPLLYVLLLCLIIPVAETGSYVACARALMLRMDARYRHAYNAVWSAGIAIGGGLASVLAGWFVRGGEARHYVLAAVINALLMLAAAAWFMRLSEAGRRYDCLQTRLFDPRHPLLSITRIWGYVLRPGASSAGIETGSGK